MTWSGAGARAEGARREEAKSVTLSSMVRSAGRLLAAVITLATADWSAGRAFGAVIDHTLESFLERTVTSPARFLISSPTMFGSLKARIFVVVSGGGFFAFSSSFLFDHQRAPDSPASRTAAINRRLSFIAVVPPEKPKTMLAA